MFGIFDKIANDEVYVIAEMSANHGGSLENALKIVHEVAKTGADCLKIQTYTADSITLDCDSEDFQIHGGLWDGYKLYDLYSDAGTPYEWQKIIKDECEKVGLDFLSTPFDNAAVDFLENIGCEAYKIASFELVDIPLIEYAASKGKPMIISCGMGSIEEIQNAIDACMRMGNNQIVLLKCCSEYPANWNDMHIANIRDMKERFGVHIGLSDHSMGSIAAVVAVSLGAEVIEKHVKLDGIKSADSEFSMSIRDFSNMVKNVRNAKKIVGNVFYGPTEGEKSNMKFRRSIYVSEDIKKGDIFNTDNIRSVRPAMGMQPKYYKDIIGKRASRDLKRGEPLSSEMIERDKRNMNMSEGSVVTNMCNNTFYSEDELKYLGIKRYGYNVLISKNAILYNPDKLEIGNNVRIDDFTTISGKVVLGDYIHIAQFCSLYGGNEGIYMENFSGISSKCTIYATSNDYSGESMTNPMVPAEYKTTDKNYPVKLEKHVVIGCSSVILPGVIVKEGSSVGAMSLITKSLQPWGVYAGIPVRYLKERSKKILDLEKRMLEDMENK